MQWNHYYARIRILVVDVDDQVAWVGVHQGAWMQSKPHPLAFCSHSLAHYWVIHEIKVGADALNVLTCPRLELGEGGSTMQVPGLGLR